MTDRDDVLTLCARVNRAFSQPEGCRPIFREGRLDAVSVFGCIESPLGAAEWMRRLLAKAGA